MFIKIYCEYYFLTVPINEVRISNFFATHSVSVFYYFIHIAVSHPAKCKAYPVLRFEIYLSNTCFHIQPTYIPLTYLECGFSIKLTYILICNRPHATFPPYFEQQICRQRTKWSADRLFKLNVRFVPLLNALLAFIVFVTTRPLMSFLSIMLTISPRKE